MAVSYVNDSMIFKLKLIYLIKFINSGREIYRLVAKLTAELAAMRQLVKQDAAQEN